MVTNDGSILAAAAVTVPFSVGLCGAAPLVTVTGETVPSLAKNAYEPMPAPAPSTAARAAPAIKAPVLRLGRSGTVAGAEYALSGGTPAGGGKSAPV
jgi:hypothetical protein